MVVTYVSKRCYSCENEWANGQIMSYHTNNRTIPYHTSNRAINLYARVYLASYPTLI